MNFHTHKFQTGVEQNLSLFKSTMVIACVQTSPLATKEIGDVSTLGSEGGNSHIKVTGMLFRKLNP